MIGTVGKPRTTERLRRCATGTASRSRRMVPVPAGQESAKAPAWVNAGFLLLGDRRVLIGPLDECGQIIAADTIGITLTLIDPLMHVGHQLVRERPCSLE